MICVHRPAGSRSCIAGRVAGGVSPPGSLRTGRDSLPSSGSHGPASEGRGELPVGEEGWLVLVYAYQPGERPGGVSPESFVLLHGPSDDVLVDAPCEEAQLGAIEGSVVVDPASGHRVDIGGQAGQVRPAAAADMPGPDLLPDRLARFAADGRHEPREVPVLAFEQAPPEGEPE